MKKLISFILLTAFLCTSILGASVFSARLGDTNGDSEVDNKDVVTLFRYVSGNKDGAVEANCDFNGDGEVNNKDVVDLFRAVSANDIPEVSDEETEEDTGEDTDTEEVTDDVTDTESSSEEIITNEDSSEEVTDDETSKEESSEEESSEPAATESETETETETEEETTEEESVEYAEKFTVSRVYGKNMVIQRNEPIRIWGWAPDTEEGKYVRAEFSGLTGKAQIKNGEWMITLDPLPENTTPQQLRIKGALKTNGKYVEKLINDVLVGDVYWIAGQSNIAYMVQYMKNEPLAPEEARTVEINNDLQIRLNRTYSADFANKGYTIGSNEVSKDVLQSRGWKKPGESDENGQNAAGNFSALGYYTALKLYNALERKVPIGMIEFDGNGLAIHSFLPNEVRDALNVSTYDAATGTYSAADVNRAKSSFIYNLAMYPFQNFPISGFIWYQGESDFGSGTSNNNNSTEYAKRFTAFIKYLRDKHDLINHDYPVYLVELPPIYDNIYDGSGNKAFIDFSAVRANMGTIPSMLENAHICSTSDLWKDNTYWNNLHPYNKWEIAERMKNIMLANSYGVGKTDYVEGPVAVSCTFSSDYKTATIKFKNVGDGLKANGGVIKGIKIGTMYSNDPSTVQITAKDTITVTYTKGKISKIGYNVKCDSTYSETLTLCNSAGVPCVAWSFSR